MTTASVDQVTVSELHLRNLFNAWKSRYRHYITFHEQTRRVVKFNTDWCRRPTPHEPLPDIRVRIEFSLRYEKDDNIRLMPTISFRIEHESFVYTALSNIDHHIIRVIKFKSTFFAQHPLKLEQAAVYASRTVYDPSYIKEKVVASDTRSEDKEEAQDVESYLVDMFSKADQDGSGALDKEEFTRMIINSKLGLTIEDVQVLQQQCDANDDGVIVYREFIPVALDLLTAQRALRYAQELVEKNRTEAFTAASKRVVDNGVLRVAVRENLQALSDADKCVPKQRFIKWLCSLDLGLSADEVDHILQSLNVGEDDEKVVVADILEFHESVFLDALLQFNLAKSASDVELYLTHLFKKADGARGGELTKSQIEQILHNSPRIKLTKIQIHVVINGIKEEIIDYKPFSRVVAYMVYKMFDKETINQKKTVIQRSAITPVELLGGRSRERIQKQMRNKFREFDVDDDGFLSPLEFHKLLADTSLSLSENEVNQYFKQADLDYDGKVSLSEFMTFSYETLLHLARDAALKTQLGK